MIESKRDDMKIQELGLSNNPSYGQICFDAFSAINAHHNFPPEIPSAAAAAGPTSRAFDWSKRLSMEGRYRCIPSSGLRYVNRWQ